MKPVAFEVRGNWLDKAIGYVAPAWGASRAKARTAMLAVRKFEGASTASRVSHWITQGSAARVETEEGVAVLRSRSHDLVRNNPYAQKGMQVVANHIVGKGIRAQFRSRQADLAAATSPTPGQPDARLVQIEATWRAWAETRACDVDGLHTLYGLQRLIARTVAESGSCLIRRVRAPRRMGQATDLPPLAISVLEPDYLDRQKDGPLANGAFISHGKEYDGKGQLVAYYIYQFHPGSGAGTPTSDRIAATEIAHIYRVDRPGQTDGYPWLTPVMIRLKDFDEFEDAYLFRQKLANCHAAFIYDADPDAAYSSDLAETLEPGTIEILPPGKDIKFNSPPAADGSENFRRFTQMAIAAGLGVTYESLSNDYGNVNFSSGRMGHLEMQRNVVSWQHHMLIPMGLDAIAAWFLEASSIGGGDATDIYAAWTPPRREMVDPAKEIPPIRDAARAGLTSPQEAIRQMGYDPDEVLADWSAFAQQVDAAGLTLDIDPRKATITGRPVEDPDAEDTTDAD